MLGAALPLTKQGLDKDVYETPEIIDELVVLVLVLASEWLLFLKVQNCTRNNFVKRRSVEKEQICPHVVLFLVTVVVVSKY